MVLVDQFSKIKWITFRLTKSHKFYQPIYKKESIIMSNEELCYLSATEALQLFKEKKLSPVDVLKAQIERIEALNGKVNCITYKHFDSALEQARESESRYLKGNPRPLEGITMAIKDENEVEGWVITMGSLLLKDASPAEENSAMIDMLQEAGTVMHIQTTVPEFYLAGSCWTRLWGVTRNPWNLEYTPGGSSGGSGAALAAGFTTLATGSDMGGSIRIPSSMCGLYGFKPPFGRVPTSDIAYESLGPIARNFTDMTLMQQVISGPHPKVHSVLRPKLDYPLEYEGIKGWKLAIDYGASLIEPDSSVREAMDKAIEQLRSLGCIVDEVDIGFKYEDFDIWARGLLSTEMGMLIVEAAQHKEFLTQYVANFVEKHGGKLGPEQAAEAAGLTTLFHRKLQDMVYGQGYQALLMPTMLTPYFYADHGMTPEKDHLMFNGKVEKSWNFATTWVWNMLNRYPVMNVPIGIAPNSIPLGMQIIGNTFDDLTAFRVAAAYAAAAPPLFMGDAFPDFRDEA
jgi:amidase